MIGVYFVVAVITAVLCFVGVCAYTRYINDKLDDETIVGLIAISIGLGAFWIIALPVAIFVGVLLLLKRFVDSIVDKIKDKKKSGSKSED